MESALGSALGLSNAVVVEACSAVVTLMVAAMEEEALKDLPQPKLKRKRAPRRYFDCYRAFDCIVSDHLGCSPMFGAEFKRLFRLSRARVQLFLEDFGRYSETNPFYRTFRTDSFGKVGSSLEVKILLPLRTLAFGVAPHTFCDYFQVSRPMAAKMCKEFYDAVSDLYTDEYLRLPTPVDLVNITKLHKRVHGVPGMIGSLDCMQTRWKNCPVAWQQSFKGRSKGMATIVL